MGGNGRHGRERKSSSSSVISFFEKAMSSIFNIFKFSSAKHDGSSYEREEGVQTQSWGPQRPWISDDEGYCWEANINEKADDFIAKFHRKNFSEPETQAVVV